MGGTREALEDVIAAELADGRFDRAATATIRGYGPQILGYLRGALRAGGDADEAFAVFCEDLWHGLPGFRGECPMRVWAYRLAWTAAMRVVGDAYRRRRRRLVSAEISGLVDEVRSTTAVHDRTTARAAIARLREELPVADRALLILKVDRDLSWREIALILASHGPPVPEAALRKRYERVKQRLKKMAAAAGLLAR